MMQQMEQLLTSIFGPLPPGVTVPAVMDLIEDFIEGARAQQQQGGAGPRPGAAPGGAPGGAPGAGPPQVPPEQQEQMMRGLGRMRR